MFASPWIVLIVVYYLECLLALFLNFYIVVVNGKSLRNGTKQNPSVVIQLIMAVINITMRLLLLIQFMALLFPDLRFGELNYIVIILLPFQMYISNWLISWLCAYYCVGIVTFTCRVFIWVRKTLLSWLPYVLILSGVGSIALSIPTIWTVNMTEVHYAENSTVPAIIYVPPVPLSSAYTITSMFLSFCLPCVISFVSLMTTVVALLKHICNIKKQGSGFSPPQVHAHVNAIRTMVLLLLLSVTFYISEMIIYNIVDYYNPLVVVCWLLVTVVPTLEAAIVI
ncbi:TPA: hypothetical protein GDO54_018669, partial [Pyxicephalus adspersus]